MKIIELRAENVKRLKAIEIHPAEHVQVIGGRNAQGKSSVLDSIWLALGGGTAAKGTPSPIRDGEKKASVTLDLGDLTVVRSWTAKGTTLKVSAADGAAYASPQGMLDALVGRLSFDPLGFVRLPARDQLAALLDLVDLGVDLDDLARKRQDAYDRRAEIGRQGKSIGDVPATLDAPGEEVSASDLIGKIRDAQSLAVSQRAEVNAMRIAVDKVAVLKDDLANWEMTLTGHTVRVAGHVPIPDIESMEASLRTVEETNRAVRHNAQVADLAARKATLVAHYRAYSDAIAAIDTTKADALAKATFPVDGLGFDDHGVTYNGIPFSQASSAEQIRVSLAMAMAINPQLRVIRILDGSLLDADSLALIEGMARDNDYQVWIERVGDADEGAVIIEDGLAL